MNSHLDTNARALHFRSIVVDTHVDTTQRLIINSMDSDFDLGARHSDGSIDIPRMREGGVSAIIFAIWVPCAVTGENAVQRALDQIDAVQRHVALHPHDLILARTSDDIRHAHAAGKIAVLMGMEGGHMINSDLSVLRQYASLGIRYMTLTHVRNNEWADASTDRPAHSGLSDFGKQVVQEMNRAGMIVDVSHVSDKTFSDVLDASQAPVMASHSCCRVICDAPRNMTDDMIRALAAKDGVMQINFHMSFLSQEFRDAEKEHPELHRQIETRTKTYGENEAHKLLESDKMIREFVAKGNLPRVEWTSIIEHIDHAVKVAGVDHVGIGSDFDGAQMAYGMEDASHLPQVTGALLQRGYSESDVQKILGGNTLRVMENVDAIALRMRGTIE